MASGVERLWSLRAAPRWTLTVSGNPVQVSDSSRAVAAANAPDVVEPTSVRPLASLDEGALIQACVDGRAGAFDLVVERNQRAVYQVCYRFVGNHEDASDLSQDVFLRAFRALGRFKGQASLATWLYRIAVNVSLNHVSMKRPITEPVESDRYVDVRSIDPAAAILQGEQGARVRAAIARLPPKQRATLVLRVYRDLSHDEISKILGSSVGAVKANFFHALGNLKKLLAGHPD